MTTNCSTEKGVGSTNDHERGIMAQDLQKILPTATRTVNNVTMADGAVVDELIVVQDRALLFESIGATKELSCIVKKDQQLTQELSTMVKKDQEILQTIGEKVEEESIAAEKTLTAAGKLLDYMLVEKSDEKQESVCCVFVAGSGKGFYGSLFGLGPAWTLYMLGFFFPLFWAFGSLFILSHSKSKKICGSLHLITFFLTVLIGCLIYYPNSAYSDPFKYAFPIFIVSLGLIAVLANGVRWNWKQNQRLRARAHRRRHEAKSQKLALMQSAKPGKVVLKTVRKSKSKSGRRAYVSVPIDDVATGGKVATHVPSSRDDARAIAVAINAKRANFAETEWERNVLLGQTNPFAN